MGQPVVHFEIMGRDGEQLQSYYRELFGWEVKADNPMNYGLVDREGNTNPDGVGIGGGVGQLGDGQGESHLTVYIEVPDVEEALQKAESLGGKRHMGPIQVMEGVEIALFIDPAGNQVGLTKAAR